jgi:hypothetical protein
MNKNKKKYIRFLKREGEEYAILCNSLNRELTALKFQIKKAEIARKVNSNFRKLQLKQEIMDITCPYSLGWQMKLEGKYCTHQILIPIILPPLNRLNKLPVKKYPSIKNGMLSLSSFLLFAWNCFSEEDGDCYNFKRGTR